VQPKLHQKVSDVILQAFLPDGDLASALASVSAREDKSSSSSSAAAAGQGGRGRPVVAVLVRICAAAAGGSSLKVQYMNQQQLIRYICLEKKESGAVLQEFMQPSGSHHCIMRTWYTPALCSHEVCSSTVAWADAKQPVNIRSRSSLTVKL